MPEISDAELRQFVRYQNLGTPEEVSKKINDLETDNKKQRDEIRDRDDKLKPFTAEGVVVLAGDEAKAYPAVKDLLSLGKPEELKGKLELGEKSTARVTELERAAAVREAAEAMGYKPSVLEKLPGADKLKFEVREETVKDAAGKESRVKVAYVTGSEQGATPKKLSDHADAEWKDFLPALAAASGTGTASSGTAGRTFASQSSGSSTGGEAKSLVDEEIEKNQKSATAPNPLRPAAATGK